MNKNLQEGIDLVSAVNQKLVEVNNDALMIFCPPFIHLSEVAKKVDNKKTFLSAQNCAAEAKGAFTGEVSAEMIASTGASYVIIGHSERRAYYHETDEILNKRLNWL